MELDYQLIDRKNGQTEVIISGSAAIARALMEASVKIIASYPGAPSTEIVENLIPFCNDHGFSVEWSVNEKVAFEIAAGAAISGMRSAFISKHVGLNVAVDSLMHLCYAGIRAGMVIISGDDPGAFQSSIEEDTRFFARSAGILGMEISDQKEAKDIVLEAFNISEKVQLPVFIRAVNRVIYGRGKVSLCEIKDLKKNSTFEKDWKRWFIAGKNALARHHWLYGQQKLLEEISEDSKFNAIEWSARKKYGVITSGISYYYVKKALADFPERDTVSILKIVCFNPLPAQKIKEFLNQLEEAIVIEESEAFIEEGIQRFAHEIDKKVRIYGKCSSHLSAVGAFSLGKVKQIIESLWGKETLPAAAEDKTIDALNHPGAHDLHSYGTFCPGCPHRFSFFALKRAVEEINQEYIFVGESGCSLYGIKPPFGLIDISFCMGSGISMASGLNKAGIKEKTVAIMGDSSFLHSGIQALINCCCNNADIFVYILDNETIAMTGLQPRSGSGIGTEGEKTKRIKIEDIIKSCGVDYLKVVDPYDIGKTKKILRKALQIRGQRVVVARHSCPPTIKGIKEKLNKKIKKYRINYKKCAQCHRCITLLGCPALSIQEGQVSIAEALCAGCGLCRKVCPHNCITN